MHIFLILSAQLFRVYPHPKKNSCFVKTYRFSRFFCPFGEIICRRAAVSILMPVSFHIPHLNRYTPSFQGKGVMNIFLGRGQGTKTDGFSEKFQTAFNPPLARDTPFMHIFLILSAQLFRVYPHPKKNSCFVKTYSFSRFFCPFGEIICRPAAVSILMPVTFHITHLNRYTPSFQGYPQKFGLLLLPN